MLVMTRKVDVTYLFCYRTQDISLTYRILYRIRISVQIYRRKMATSNQIPIPVRRALRKLGGDIRDARRRRRIPTQVMAERASVSRTTLLKVEKGDPGVSVGTFATVLFVLGLIDRFSELADARYDEVGLDLADEWLPQRIRLSRRKRAD